MKPSSEPCSGPERTRTSCRKQSGSVHRPPATGATVERFARSTSRYCSPRSTFAPRSRPTLEDVTPPPFPRGVRHRARRSQLRATVRDREAARARVDRTRPHHQRQATRGTGRTGTVRDLNHSTNEREIMIVYSPLLPLAERLAALRALVSAGKAVGK